MNVGFQAIQNVVHLHVPKSGVSEAGIFKCSGFSLIVRFDSSSS